MAMTGCGVQTYQSKVRRREGERGKWERKRDRETLRTLKFLCRLFKSICTTLKAF